MADALLRERLQQTSPAFVAASLAPGTKIYVKGKGHAEYMGPCDSNVDSGTVGLPLGAQDGRKLEFANGIVQTVHLDKTEWTRVKEPPQTGLGRGTYATAPDRPAAVGLGHALGWAGLDSLDEFEAKHSPRNTARVNALVRGLYDNGPAPTRRMSREQPSQQNPLLVVPGRALDDPYRSSEAESRTPRQMLSQQEPEPEPQAADDENMRVLPGGLTLAEANRLKEEARVLELAKATRRQREVLELVRDKIEAKSIRLTNMYRQFDENRDGVVSYSEFQQGLHKLGIELDKQEFSTLVETVDVDSQGTIDYNEFACAQTTIVLFHMYAECYVRSHCPLTVLLLRACGIMEWNPARC